MSDDKSKKGYQDDGKIDMNDPNEVRYRCNKWGITKEQLQAAVDAVGTGAKKVKEYLGV